MTDRNQTMVNIRPISATSDFPLSDLKSFVYLKNAAWGKERLMSDRNLFDGQISDWFLHLLISRQHKTGERHSSWNVFDKCRPEIDSWWEKTRQNKSLQLKKTTKKDSFFISFILRGPWDLKTILIDFKKLNKILLFLFYSSQEAKKACKLIRDRFGITEVSQHRFFGESNFFFWQSD